MGSTQWNEPQLFLDSSTGNPIPKPRFLLRFYINCISGAKRNDCLIQPNTRIVGTIPIWDDIEQIEHIRKQLDNVVKQKQLLAAGSGKDDSMQIEKDNDNNDDDSNNSILETWGEALMEVVSRLFSSRGQKGDQSNVTDNEKIASLLSYRQEQLERLLPIKGCVTTASDNNGSIIVAPKGSLMMPFIDKEESNKQYKYIIGSFTMSPR